MLPYLDQPGLLGPVLRPRVPQTNHSVDAAWGEKGGAGVALHAVNRRAVSVQNLDDNSCGWVKKRKEEKKSAIDFQRADCYTRRMGTQVTSRIKLTTNANTNTILKHLHNVEIGKTNRYDRED